MRSTTEPRHERPLSGLARQALIFTTAVTIALFYLFISVSLLLLLIWIGLLLLVLLGLARFGLSGLFVKFVQRDIQLLVLVSRALWLSEGAVYRLRLEPADAPRLFAMIQKLAARLVIPPPEEICLEMSCGAWVELQGLKPGLGTTRVGVGYDLLASLNEHEVEGVLAHELSHAKLISRVFRNWVFDGFRRAARVSNQLSATADAYRRAHDSFGVGDWLLAGADVLTRLCARQIGAYSRQHEFEADRGAAQLCGAAAIRSSLQRLERVQPKLRRLPWNERVARIESPEGLSRWLLQELAVPDSDEETGTTEVFDRYSTHPALHVRIAALPDDGTPLPPSPTGLGLLANPDQIALKLVDAIERTALKQEREDLRELRKWLGTVRRSGNIRAAQLPGAIILLGGLVFGTIALFSGFQTAGLVLLFTLLPLGYWLYRICHYRDRQDLPVPDFEVFMKARQYFPLPDIEALQKTAEQELRANLAGEPKKKRKAARLIEEAYAALAGADYLRAHVAARLAAEFGTDSVERGLAMMIAAAAFDQGGVVDPLLQATVKRTGLRSPSTAFATAWAFMLGGSWMQAEALLHETLKTRPADANILAMLAFSQSRRGKLQSAIENIKRSSHPHPPTNQHLKLLVSLLLDRGTLREAADRLGDFGPAATYDPEVVYLRIRLHLLHREFAAAEKQLALLAESEFTGRRLLDIGYLYEQARADARAAEFFHRALTRGHYPEALLALARQAAEAKDKAKAREYIHAALDTTKPLGERTASALDLLPQALAGLLGLEEPVANCRAWIASFLPGKDAGPLTRRSLFVFASTQQEVETYLQNLMRVMQPGTPPLAPAYMRIKAAPRDLQPVRPVQPGIQYIYR